MEIINPGTAPAAADVKAAPAKEDSEFVKGVQKAVEKATEEVVSERKDEPKGIPEDVDVKAALKDNVVAASVDASQTAAEELSNYTGKPREEIKVGQQHKDDFINCLVTGDRYRETFSRFGGKLKIVVRSRTSDETSAILSYVRRKVVSGVNSSIDIYSTYIRKAIVAAQVEEVNGVKYEELAKPYYFVETPNGLESPGWEKQLDMWGGKSEQIFSVCADCVIEFEARYWHMMAHANDENFWNPGESTGN